MAEKHSTGHHAAEAGYDRGAERSGLIAIVSVATVILLVGMIVGVYWLYVRTYEQVEYDQYSGVASKELLALQEREEEQLYRYAYIDREKGVVRIPIDRAMELLVSEYKEGKLFYNTKTYPVKPENPAASSTPDEASKK
jgi:hypothetical protein